MTPMTKMTTMTTATTTTSITNVNTVTDRIQSFLMDCKLLFFNTTKMCVCASLWHARLSTIHGLMWCCVVLFYFVSKVFSTQPFLNCVILFSLAIHLIRRYMHACIQCMCVCMYAIKIWYMCMVVDLYECVCVWIVYLKKKLCVHCATVTIACSF